MQTEAATREEGVPLQWTIATEISNSTTFMVRTDSCHPVLVAVFRWNRGCLCSGTAGRQAVGACVIEMGALDSVMHSTGAHEGLCCCEDGAVGTGSGTAAGVIAHCRTSVPQPFARVRACPAAVKLGRC